MTARQKLVMWLGTALVVAMGLYPPWIQVKPGYMATREERRFAYGWIFAPPLLRAQRSVPEATRQGAESLSSGRTKIDFGKLAAEPAPSEQTMPLEPKAEKPDIRLMMEALRSSEQTVPTEPEPERGWHTELDIKRLLVQWVMACFVSGVLLWTNKDTGERPLR